MTKLPPFIARQERRRQLERLRADKRELNTDEHSVEWSHENYERLMERIMALDPATRMLPSGVH